MRACVGGCGGDSIHDMGLAGRLTDRLCILDRLISLGMAWHGMAGFPPRELTDFGRTLEEAGLKNARITQRLV